MNRPHGSHLRTADARGVRTITIDRAEVHNALTGAMRAELVQLFADADADTSVHAVVLTGVDPSFSAGVDYTDLATPTDGADPAPDTSTSTQSERVDPATALRRMRTPVIAAVNGACVSGALEMALSTSFVIASERARFADTHARLDVLPMWGLSALLPRAVGVRRARQMSLTGEFIDAARALTWGLVNEVVPHEQLLERAHTVAERIHTTSAASELLALYGQGEGLDLAAAIELETRTARARTGFDATAFAEAGRRTAERSFTQRSQSGNRGDIAP